MEPGKTAIEMAIEWNVEITTVRRWIKSAGFTLVNNPNNPTRFTAEEARKIAGMSSPQWFKNRKRAPII